jgi:hypothetical protein
MVSVNLTTPNDPTNPPPYSEDQIWAFPGWQQEESISPHVIGDQGGTTRQTTFSGRASADSDLIVASDVSIVGNFNSTGVALDTTLVGDVASTAVYDLDSKFLPVRKFPAVASGYEEASMDLVQRLYGDLAVTVPWTGGRGDIHAYYPMRGYNQGFSLDGQNTLYTQNWGGEGYTGSVDAYRGEHGCYAPSFYRPTHTVAVPLDQRSVYAGYAQIFQNPLFSGTDVNYQALRVRMTQSVYMEQAIIQKWPSSPQNTTISVKFTRTGTSAGSGTLAISGTYRVGTTSTAITTVSTPITGLTPTKELGMVVQWGYLADTNPATLRVKAYMYDPDSPPAGAPVVVVQTDLLNSVRPEGGSGYLQHNGTEGGFRDVIASQTDSTWPVHYPVIPVPDLMRWDQITRSVGGFVGNGISSRGTSTVEWEGSGWDYLKMLCTARGLQMKLDANGRLEFTTVLQPPGTTQAASVPTPVSDLMDEPTLTIQASNRARSVDVVCHRSQQKGNFELRDLSLTIEEDMAVTAVVTLPPGEYPGDQIDEIQVVDSENRLIRWTSMRYHGASINGSVRGNLLTLTLAGPDSNRSPSINPIGEGPWTVTGFRMFNTSGFMELPETITLYTGAPESTIGREQGGNIDNPFLGSRADVWNRSTWLISAEGSPRVTLDFTVPARSRSRYAIGQLVSFGWGVFRVMNVVSGKSSASISCDWFTTQATQSPRWTSLTADDWNTYWSGRRSYDVFLRPLAVGSTFYDLQPFVRSYPSESK